MMNDTQPTLTYYLFASAHPVDWIFTPPHSRASHNVFLMRFLALTFLGFEQGSLTLTAVELHHHNQVFMRQQRGRMKGIWFDRPSASETKQSTMEANQTLASEGLTCTLQQSEPYLFNWGHAKSVHGYASHYHGSRFSACFGSDQRIAKWRC